jgi:hypothetical protein
VLKKRKIIATESKNGTNEDHSTVHTRKLAADLRLREANKYSVLFLLYGSPLDELLVTVCPTIVERDGNMREAVTVSIYKLRYAIWPLKDSEHLKFDFWTRLELAREMVPECILSTTVHRLLNIFEIAQ